MSALLAIRFELETKIYPIISRGAPSVMSLAGMLLAAPGLVSPAVDVTGRWEE